MPSAPNFDPSILTTKQRDEAASTIRKIRQNPHAKLGATQASITPLDGFILFEREPEATHAGLIELIPKGNAARGEATWARVLKLGKPLRARKNDQPIDFTLQVGDRVLLNKFCGHDIKLEDGKPYVLAIETDVILRDARPGESF